MSSVVDDLMGLFGAQPKQTPEQQRCTHLLASKMADGKWFCPVCKLVSPYALRGDR